MTDYNMWSWYQTGGTTGSQIKGYTQFRQLEMTQLREVALTFHGLQLKSYGDVFNVQDAGSTYLVTLEKKSKSGADLKSYSKMLLK